LSGDEQLNGPLDSTAKRESTAISNLLGRSRLRRPSSVDLGWKNFAVERRTILSCEKLEVKLQHHFLILCDVRVAKGESAYRCRSPRLRKALNLGRVTMYRALCMLFISNTF
jgi:hypothetical protein